MNMIRKVLNVFTLVIGTFGILVSPVGAAPTIPNPLTLTSIADVITRVSGFVQPFALLGLVACIIGAGFVRLTSSGDPDKEQKSVKILTSAAIGFAIIVLAPLVVRILGTILGLNSTLNTI